MKTRRRPCGLKYAARWTARKLPDADHRPSDGRILPDRIRNDQPHIGMRFDDQGRALDGGSVGAFAALGETRGDQRRWIGERRHAEAGFALAAEIVVQALAIGSLREHPGERIFADAARTGKTAWR